MKYTTEYFNHELRGLGDNLYFKARINKNKITLTKAKYVNGLGELREKSGVDTLKKHHLKGWLWTHNEVARGYHTTGKNRNSTDLDRDDNREMEISQQKNDKHLFANSMTADKLKEAWYQIKSHPGMLTKGSNNEIIDKISDKWFEIISKKILNEDFKYPPARRTEIPKPAGKIGTRPLIITNPRIKIIERAILNALEPIFEGLYETTESTTAIESSSKKELHDTRYYPKHIKKKTKSLFDSTIIEKKATKKIRNYINPTIFLPVSYGFRPKKSAHQALHQIKTWKTNTSYILDYDIKKAFGTINRNRLRNEFNKYIVDPRFWLEIHKLLEAGYIIEDLKIEQNIGVNQGSILSPFLFNIYMHSLDEKILELQKKHSVDNLKSIDKGYGDKEAIKNYDRIRYKYIKNAVKTAQKLGIEQYRREMKLEYLQHYRKYGRADGIERTNRDIQYCRYADDFIVGIVGNRKFAELIRSEIDLFIKSELHLELSKNEILHRDGKSKCTFLGHQIMIPHFHQKTRTKSAKTEALYKLRERSKARFKLEQTKLTKTITDSFRKKFLIHLDHISNKLNLKHHKKNDFDILTMLTAYKEMGLSIARNFDIPNLKQLAETLENPDTANNVKFNNPAFERFFQIIETRQQNDQYALIQHMKTHAKILDASILDESDLGIKLKSITNEFKEKIDRLVNESKFEILDKHRKKLTDKFLKNRTKTEIARSGLTLTPDEQKFINELAAIFRDRELDTDRVRAISLKADLKKLSTKFINAKMMHPFKNKACQCDYLKIQDNYTIINYYNNIIMGLLNWFSGADNFSSVKGFITNIVWLSCLLTLQNKHKLATLQQVYLIFGNDISTAKLGGKTIKLISKETIGNFKSGFNLGINTEPFNIDNLLNTSLTRSHGLLFFEKCSIVECENKDIEIHHIQKLHRKVRENGKITILDKNNKPVKGIAAILSAINRKQLPLCKKHHLEFEKGIYSPLNESWLNIILNRHNEDHPLGFPENMETVFKGEPYRKKKKKKAPEK